MGKLPSDSNRNIFMLHGAVRHTVNQMFHPAFRRVFVLGLLMAIFVIALCLFGLRTIWPESANTGWLWLDEALTGWVAFTSVSVVAGYFLFPVVAIVFMGLLLDQVITAVEDEHYPYRRATRKVSFGENATMALKQGFVVLVVNLFALVLYIPLFLMSFGMLAAALYLLLNGYLLGREYFDMVAVRFRKASGARRLRRDNSGDAFRAGAVIASLFLVPILNLLAPIFGAALMTHVVHRSLENDGGPAHE